MSSRLGKRKREEPEEEVRPIQGMTGVEAYLHAINGKFATAPAKSQTSNHEVEVVEMTEEWRTVSKDTINAKSYNSTKSLQRTTKANSKTLDDEDKAHANNDRALERLVSYSWDRDPVTGAQLYGKEKLRALDRRFQEIGVKSSLFDQKMPQAQRQRMNANEKKRDEKREKEARINNIILEKPQRNTKQSRFNNKRQRGIGGPGVGKFSGGTLVLDKKAVRSIEGPKERSGGKRYKKGGPGAG